MASLKNDRRLFLNLQFIWRAKWWERWRNWDRERSCIYWFTLQLPSPGRAGLGQTGQEPVTQSGSFLWVAGTQVCTCAKPCYLPEYVLTRTWNRTQEAGFKPRLSCMGCRCPKWYRTSCDKCLVWFLDSTEKGMDRGRKSSDCWTKTRECLAEGALSFI